jgi:hypothetical protein
MNSPRDSEDSLSPEKNPFPRGEASRLRGSKFLDEAPPQVSSFTQKLASEHKTPINDWYWNYTPSPDLKNFSDQDFLGEAHSKGSFSSQSNSNSNSSSDNNCSPRPPGYDLDSEQPIETQKPRLDSYSPHQPIFSESSHEPRVNVSCPVEDSINKSHSDSTGNVEPKGEPPCQKTKHNHYNPHEETSIENCTRHMNACRVKIRNFAPGVTETEVENYCVCCGQPIYPKNVRFCESLENLNKIIGSGACLYFDLIKFYIYALA